MAEAEEDFSTIEHDFLHTKDYFSNYKFPYKERKSKLDFFQNIHAPIAQDTTALLEASKAQLVEVKQQYRDMDQQIKQLSLDIYATDLRLIQRSAELAELEEEEAALRAEYEQTRHLDEKLQINSSLNEELEAIENRIKSSYAQINQAQEAIGRFDLDARRAEEAELRAHKLELAAKQKRLTVINTDSYIEDIYAWHQHLQMILENVFGTVTTHCEENRLVLRVAFKGAVLEMVVKDQRLVGCSLSGSPCAAAVERFNGSREHSLATNNPLFLVAQTLLVAD
ncbi:hypothetical protein PAPHI01_0292 [Pancytospora philotis]|nr:hypothetical protein PAPHI01_0292 [Pancytospora philotis]